MINLGFRQRWYSSREDGESLYEADTEQHHLIPTQRPRHTVPLSNSSQIEISETQKPWDSEEKLGRVVGVGIQADRVPSSRFELVNSIFFHPLNSPAH